MPRAIKSDHFKQSSDNVFHLIVGVTIIALLSGINFFYFDSSAVPAGNKGVADVSRSVVIDTSAPKAALSPTFVENEIARAPQYNPSDLKPQCDFRSNVRNIIYGQSIDFSWDCVNATSCTLDGVGKVGVSNKGGVEVTPRRSAKYQLICNNDRETRSFDIDINVFEFTIQEVSVPNASK
ncbi:MAG: hypothetical protein PHG66_05675 [Candidatus Colwellbacteria bacterium]|nr:hypothetical protein [Candidatus Colwellbacteria bacterium]